MERLSEKVEGVKESKGSKGKQQRSPFSREAQPSVFS
jgi:hypothetical protein